jgi:methyltransferase (TIGR00027 family)
VPADLRGDWPKALVAAGFLPSEPAAWLLEGILMYLADDGRELLLDQVGALSAPGSHLALDQRGAAQREEPRLAGTPKGAYKSAKSETDAEAARLGVRIPGVEPEASTENLAAWLNRHGWRAQVYNAVERFALYGREVERSVKEAAAQLWLASATVDKALRMTG